MFETSIPMSLPLKCVKNVHFFPRDIDSTLLNSPQCLEHSRSHVFNRKLHHPEFPQDLILFSSSSSSSLYIHIHTLYLKHLFKVNSSNDDNVLMPLAWMSVYLLTLCQEKLNTDTSLRAKYHQYGFVQFLYG